VIAHLNESAPFYPASAIKVVHLLHAMRWATDRLDEPMGIQIPVFADSCSGSGAFSPRPLEHLLREMMIDSNNQSTNALQDFFGVEQLSETMASAGMSNSAIHHKFGCGGPSNDPANQTTTGDLASLYTGVADGTLLADTEREHFLATMIDAVELIPDTSSSGSTFGEVTHVYLKEGWYGNTLTLGGLVVRNGDTSSPDQWVFALFTQDAITIAPDFEITDLITDLSAMGAFEP